MAAEQPELEQYMDVVRGLARGLARRLRTDAVVIEELEADGFEALVKALKDYESSKGPLVPYIILRCRGAMTDGLRRRMLITREDRRAGVTEPAVAEGISQSRLAQIESRIRRRLKGVAGIADSGQLTPKELTVLRLAAEGASAAETAKRLSKAVETVKSQRCAIISKLHARNMTNAVAISYQLGLLGAAASHERGAGGSSARHR